MIGCLRTRVCKQPTIALYFESETVFKFYNLEAREGDLNACLLRDGRMHVGFFSSVTIKELSYKARSHSSTFISLNADAIRHVRG